MPHPSFDSEGGFELP